MKVSVVICTKNEERGIAEVIEACKPHADEIVIMDGHSTDRTRELSESLGAKFFLDNGKGKGDGIRKSAEVVSHEIIVFIDADLSHDANDIPLLVEKIREGNDLVIASRKRGGSDELHGGFKEFVRLVGSGIITMSINYRFKKHLTDSQNGFRAIRTEVLKDLGLVENIFTIEQEMLMKALKKGYTVDEVPSHEYRRKYGDSRIKVRNVAFRYVYTLIKYLI